MKKAVKILLCIVGVLALLVGLFCYWWYRGVDLEKRYKDLFDKTFGGKYTMTVTDSGTYAAETGKIKLPSKYKDYDVMYFDKDGNERHFELSGKVGLGGSFRSMVSTAVNRGRYLDLDVMRAMENESSKIFLDQVRKSLKKYYGKGLKNDNDYLLSLLRKINGNGYEIELLSQDYSYMYLYEDTYMDIVFSKESREKIKKAVSPDTCIMLSKQDMQDYANHKSAYLGVVVTLRNKKNVKKADKFREKTEALLTDLADRTGFGGNYYYKILKDKDPADDVPVKTLFEKDIVFGKEIASAGGSNDYSSALKSTLENI